MRLSARAFHRAVHGAVGSSTLVRQCIMHSRLAACAVKLPSSVGIPCQNAGGVGYMRYADAFINSICVDEEEWKRR